MSSKRGSEFHTAFARATAEASIEKAKPRGMYSRISDDDIEIALERLANGDTMKSVTADLGVTRNALLKRANTDDEFGRQLHVAMEIGVFAMLENSLDALRMGESSTKDFQRDREIARFSQWYAARVGRRFFGDRVQVDQGSVNVIMPDWAIAVSSKALIEHQDDDQGDGEEE